MKVLLLGISDRYWARFVKEYSEFLSSEGFEVVVVLESRLGEYQEYGRRQTYSNCKVYYLTDFVRDNPGAANATHRTVENNRLGVFSDYLRLYMLNDFHSLKKFDFAIYDSYLNNFFEHIFDEHPGINCVLHDQVSTGFAFVCWQIATSRSVRYIGLGGGRISGRVEVKESPIQESDRVQAIFEGIRDGSIKVATQDRKDADTYIQSIEESTPDYMRLSPLSNPRIFNVLNREKLINLIGLLKYLIFDSDGDNLAQLYKFPFRDALRSAKRNMIRLLRVNFLHPKFDHVPDDWSILQPYYVYPLHFQPEATSCVESQYYSDQLLMLRNISFSLPKNVRLVVKEHRTNYGYVNGRFYDQIKILPNVMLIGPNCNIKHAIKHSIGVITLNSTAGLEALVMNKPVVALGKVFYTFHRNCYMVDGWSTLRQVLSELAINGGVVSVDSDYTRDFICSYFKSTLRGIIDFESSFFDIKKQLRSYLTQLD